MNLMNKKGTKTNQQNLKFSPANHSRFRKNPKLLVTSRLIKRPAGCLAPNK